MKKNILLITTSLLLSSGLSIHYSTTNSSQANNLTPVELSKPKITSSLVAQASNISEDSKPAVSDSYGEFLNEKIIGDSSFPLLTLPEGVPEDINTEVAKYFQEQITKEEREANFKEIPQTSLDKIQDFIQLDEDLDQLNTSIDQVKLEMGETTVYVPRLIVPITYSQAEELAEDNDTRLLNLALTELGNRLVLLAYYNDDTDELLPMHLINSAHSFFYYELPAN